MTSRPLRPMYLYPNLKFPVHCLMRMSSSGLSQLNRSWLSQANSRMSSTESRTNLSMMSRAWTSMMMSWFTFLRSSLLRSDRTIPVRSTSCPVSFTAKSFMAYLLPSRTRRNTSSTSHVHQIWDPTSVIIPRFCLIHCVRTDLA